MSMRPLRVALAGLLLMLAAVAPARAEGPQAVRIDGGPTSATNSTPVRLDLDVYMPPTTDPAPVVVLAQIGRAHV